jgi:hypothetical protein
MNLCITCSHFELHPDSKDPETGLCQRIPPKISLVTGLPVQPLNNFANVERLHHNSCGMDGKHHTDKSLSVFTPEVPNV